MTWEYICPKCGKTVIYRKQPGYVMARTRGSLCAACNRESRITHDGARHPLYQAWQHMKRRCLYDPGYNERGITVCAEWQAYESFRDWAVANGYQPDLTIDRINNDGNYEPGNCRWTTQAVQSRNKRNNVLITAFGETKVAKDWELDPRCSIEDENIIRRIAKGWDAETAISTPDTRRNQTECVNGHKFTPETPGMPRMAPECA